MGERPVDADQYYVGDDAGGADDGAWPEELKPLYGQLSHLMQQGMWRDASEVLVALETRCPADGRLAEVRRQLGLHLSAEQSWTGKRRRRTSSSRRLIRALLVANVLLYSLLIALFLLGKGAAF